MKNLNGIDCHRGMMKFRCDECSFAVPESLTCANPNVWNGSSDDTYCIPKGSPLNDEERYWVEKLLQ